MTDRTSAAVDTVVVETATVVAAGCGGLDCSRADRVPRACIAVRHHDHDADRGTDDDDDRGREHRGLHHQLTLT
jgi:hypothetical protein